MDLQYELNAVFASFDVDTAVEKMIEYFDSAYGEDERTDAFYNLANFMHKKGILPDDIKNKAAALIDKEIQEGNPLYVEAGAMSMRARQLRAFKKKLLTDVREPRKVRLRTKKPLFNKGDVIAFRLDPAESNGERHGSFFWAEDREAERERLSRYEGKYCVFLKIADTFGGQSEIVPDVKFDTSEIYAAFAVISEEKPNADTVAACGGKLLNMAREGIVGMHYDQEAKKVLTDDEVFDYNIRLVSASFDFCDGSSKRFFRRREYDVIGNDSVFADELIAEAEKSTRRWMGKLLPNRGFAFNGDIYYAIAKNFDEKNFV
jgi:hypothetical protein